MTQGTRRAAIAGALATIVALIPATASAKTPKTVEVPWTTAVQCGQSSISVLRGALATPPWDSYDTFDETAANARATFPAGTTFNAWKMPSGGFIAVADSTFGFGGATYTVPKGALFNLGCYHSRDKKEKWYSPNVRLWLEYVPSITATVKITKKSKHALHASIRTDQVNTHAGESGLRTQTVTIAFTDAKTVATSKYKVMMTGQKGKSAGVCIWVRKGQYDAKGHIKTLKK